MTTVTPFAIRTFIENHPLAEYLRKDKDLVESRGYQNYPSDLREQSLTAGPLTGPGMISVPPYVFATRNGERLIEIIYLGKNVSGFPGMVHGGLLATLLDEGMGWCCFPTLPGHAGATVSLDVEYLSPMPTESFAVLKAQTSRTLERKAWVEGHIETLPNDGEPIVIAKARALFVAPRNVKLGF